MIVLESWIHTPLAQSLGLALVHSLWEGAAIALLLAAALCVARSPGARYGVACIAMLLMLASFATTVIYVFPDPANAAVARPLAKVPAAPAELPLIPGDGLPRPSALARSLPWIAAFWACGVLLFHLRALGGWMAARRLRQSGVCRAPGEWQQLLDRLTARVLLAKPVVLLESCLADAPVVIGYLRPVILMPVGLLAGLPMAQVEAILIHELAHIRRQDYLVNLMQTFVEGLLFYHPAVWWISGIIRAERENCCDDLAVAATGDARGYATALAALEHNRSAVHELALAANGGNLVKRIRRLLQQPERPRAAGTPVISAGLLVVGAAVAFAAWQTPAQRQAAAAPDAPVIAQAAPVAVVQVPKKNGVAPIPGQSPYRKWLNEDVAYIITDEERAAFKALTTDDEREHFIEQFWLRRDPTPGTDVNEFKVEHYRRIAYANEHFSTSAGLPGWKTDRGRIYITYGPPDEIEDHSSSGTYIRPPEQGGGTTAVFPFQQWRYKYIAGVGSNIIIEFVDPTYTREYRMTMDPAEKDALRLVKPPKPVLASRIMPEMSTGNIFVSPGSDAMVTVSILPAGLMRVRVALPPGTGKYDIVCDVRTTQNQVVANSRESYSKVGPYDMAFTMKPGSYILTVWVRDTVSGTTKTGTVSYYVN